MCCVLVMLEDKGPHETTKYDLSSKRGETTDNMEGLWWRRLVVLAVMVTVLILAVIFRIITEFNVHESST